MNYIIFSIWHKLILVCFLINGIHGISFVKQYNATDQPTNISLNPENQENTKEIDQNLDFIIKLQFILNEQKIIPYLKDEIYNDYELHNITTEDLIDLWKLRDVPLSDLSLLIGIPDTLFDLYSLKQVLDIANLTFNEYFTEMKRNISRMELQQTLEILNIDLLNFSSAITFGNETEIYEVLRKGIYTWKKFEEVKNKTGLDIPELTKNIILDQITSKTIRKLVEDIQGFPMVNKEMYQNIWDKTNISTYDIYRIQNLRTIVNNIHEHVAENITFGIAISENEMILHKNIIENLGGMWDIVTVYGESSTSHHVYDNLTLMKGMTNSTSVLWSNNTLSKKIDIMDRIVNESSLNCSYIDSNLTENNVTLITVTQTDITVGVDDDVHFNMGNPLLCNGKLVGLAVNNINDSNFFIFDTFFKTVEEVSNDTLSPSYNSYVILLPIFLLYCLM